MNCKHAVATGKTTKYFKCEITSRPTNEIKCRDCLLKLPNDNKNIENFLRGLWNGHK